jgi:hypothetical protein
MDGAIAYCHIAVDPNWEGSRRIVVQRRRLGEPS